MKNVAWGRTRGLGARVAVGALAAAMAAGCSSAAPDSSSTAVQTGVHHAADGGTYASGSDAAIDAGPLVVTCTPVAGGVGAVSTNNGSPRQFYVDVPTDTSQPMALMFSWHGYNQLPTDFRKQLGFDPNGASMPIVVVTPTDTGIFLPEGLDWDILKSSGNVDFPYFEGMLQCLESQFNIDKTRVYSFGFSAGAVFTNLLDSQYPQLFAAIVTESGAWFSDPAEAATVLVNVEPWAWPPLNPADRGNVLMTHGGPNDFATILSLEAAAQAALPFLLKNQRTVIDCAHTLGHAIDPDVTNPLIYEYFLAHRLGQPSPFQDGKMPADFPSTCALSLP
jgi:predicted esterase